MYQLFHGSFENILPRVGFVNAVITDPPYAVTRAKCDSPVNLTLFWRLVESLKYKENMPSLLFCNQPFTTDLINSNRRHFKYCWYWIKNRKTNFVNAHKMPMRQLEEIAVFYCPPPPIYNLNLQFDATRIKTMKRNKSIKMYCEDERLFMFENQFSITKKQSGYTGFYSNVLFFDSPDEREHTNHPFQKPVDLLKFLIQVYTREGDTVLDPFMGSGTTGVACQKTNRHFIGVERDAEYYRIAQERIDRI